MPKFLRSLFGQVVLALIVGVTVGVVWPEFAIKLKPLGDAFIRLIKMIIPILVFCVVVHGIAAAGDLKRVGRVGVKALIYFEVVTTIALALGLLLAFVFQPGVGMNVDPKALDASAMSAYTETAGKLTGGGTVEFLMRLIPSTVGNALSTGDVLQVLLFAILFGCALSLLGERGAPVTNFIESLSHVVFKIMGIRDSTVGLVIPTGYSFNLDAFSIYITLAAVFIAQATNTHITMSHLLTILAVALVTSRGAHGVPGSAIVVLAATLQAIPEIPAICLGMVLSVDWFMGIARALGNLTGNCVATVVVAAWGGDIDRDRAHAVLDGRAIPATEDDLDVTQGSPAFVRI